MVKKKKSAEKLNISYRTNRALHKIVQTPGSTDVLSTRKREPSPQLGVLGKIKGLGGLFLENTTPFLADIPSSKVS